MFLGLLELITVFCLNLLNFAKLIAKFHGRFGILLLQQRVFDAQINTIIKATGQSRATWQLISKPQSTLLGLASRIFEQW